MPVKEPKLPTVKKLNTPDPRLLLLHNILTAILRRVHRSDFDKFADLYKLDLGNFFLLLPQFYDMLQQEGLRFDDLRWLLSKESKSLPQDEMENRGCDYLLSMAKQWIQRKQKVIVYSVLFGDQNVVSLIHFGG